MDWERWSDGVEKCVFPILLLISVGGFLQSFKVYLNRNEMLIKHFISCTDNT